ncbi:MAG: undecaprenyl/decaprenyl-phosphate alpha-N-acetylglucosaminyl 1-phosphate transferase [Nitrospirae bacterium]|nr:undecaprenyl/decaprenyl-phosphate alpha-N-acetylglucosaminyl 1-phosphate transferase [Nitrospirota bacterium]
MKLEFYAVYFLTFVLSFLLAIYGTPMARQAAIKFGIVDRPDGNLKVQRDPVPYLGGLAIYLAFLLALSLTFTFSYELLGIMLGGTIIVLLGLIDDFGVLQPEVKLIGQIIAAFVLIKSGTMIYLTFIPFWLRVFLTGLWIVGVTNAFNIIDVMDGLSSGIAAIAAITLSVVAIGNEKTTVAIMAIALAGSALGFLRYNFHPAKIYMGDTGSMFLGFTLAALSIGNTVGSYTKTNYFGFIAPVLILGVPIFDTLLVMFFRFRKGISMFHGSNDHFAIRLKRLGWPVRRIVVASYLAAAMLSAWALVLIRVSYLPYLYVCIGLLAVVVAFIAFMLGRINVEA